MTGGPGDGASDGSSERSPSAPESEAGAAEDSPEDGPDEIVDEPPLTVRAVAGEEPRLRRGRNIDQTRAGLAWALVWIFGGTVAAVLLIVALTSPHPASDVTELLRTLVPAETALLGSAVGFYFGTRTRP
jgi:hypothetical protein